MSEVCPGLKKRHTIVSIFIPSLRVGRERDFEGSSDHPVSGPFRREPVRPEDPKPDLLVDPETDLECR